MSEISLGNKKNSLCPFCDKKVYITDWNIEENKALNIGDIVTTNCSYCGQTYSAKLVYISGNSFGIRYFEPIIENIS
jgi:uncharacterized Zn-finger protein